MQSLSPHHSKQRARVALLAVLCVLFLCWGQQSGWVAASCPQAQQSEQSLDGKIVVAKCDSSSQLLQQAHFNILDGGAAISLFLGFVLIFSSRSRFFVQTQSPPAKRRYRPHLIFCVFNE